MLGRASRWASPGCAVRADDDQGLRWPARASRTSGRACWVGRWRSGWSRTRSRHRWRGSREAPARVGAGVHSSAAQPSQRSRVWPQRGHPPPDLGWDPRAGSEVGGVDQAAAGVAEHPFASALVSRSISRRPPCRAGRSRKVTWWRGVPAVGSLAGAGDPLVVAQGAADATCRPAWRCWAQRPARCPQVWTVIQRRGRPSTARRNSQTTPRGVPADGSVGESAGDGEDVHDVLPVMGGGGGLSLR